MKAKLSCIFKEKKKVKTNSRFARPVSVWEKRSRNKESLCHAVMTKYSLKIIKI